MNKKIKVIDLIDKIYHKNNIPKKIQIGENIYSYDYDMGYYRKSDEEFNLRVYLTEDLGLDVYEDLVREVEILEDNTEEIEKLDRSLKFDDLIEPYGKNEDMMWTEIIKQHNKIDEIIRYVKRKDKNND